jgi:integrase
LVLPGPITKTKKERVVPVTARLMREFELMAGPNWPSYCESTVGVKHAIFGGASWKTSWSTACEHSGIDGLHFYDLRHTFSTRLQELGLASAFVSRLMGHSVPADKSVSPTTFIYTNVTEQMLDMARQMLESEESLRHTLREQQDTSVSEIDSQSQTIALSDSPLDSIADTTGSQVM